MANTDKRGLMKHLSAYIMRGVLFMIPIAVTLFIIRFIAGMSEAWLGPLTAAIVRALVPSSWLTGPFEGGYIPGLSLILFLFVLLLLGWVGSMYIGRQGLRLIDHIFQAIPGVRVIYSAARKVVEAVGEDNKSTFQRAVLINWGPHGTKTMGFVTKETFDKTEKRKYLVVFVPTPPNPASGFITFVPEDEAVDPGFTMEEALKIAMSLGVLTPQELFVTRSKTSDASPDSTGAESSKS